MISCLFTVSDNPDAFNRGMSRGYSVRTPLLRPLLRPLEHQPVWLLSLTTPPVSFSPHKMEKEKKKKALTIFFLPFSLFEYLKPL